MKNTNKTDEVNDSLIKIDKYPISGTPGLAISKKNEQGHIIDWILVDDKDEVKKFYEQMEKEVHQNRANLNK